MKKLFSLTALLFLCFYVPAQQVFLEKKFEDARFTDIIVAPDGYYVLGAYERTWLIGHEWHRGFTSFVAKLDGDFNVLFETKFPEGRFESFHEMAAVEDGIWLIGSYYAPSDPDRAQGWIHKLDFQGNRMFDRKLPHTGYHSTEGKKVRILRDGSVVFNVQLYRNYNSYGHHRLYGFTADGRELWHTDLEPHKTLASVNDFIENEDGSILVAGFVYNSKSELTTTGSNAWLYRFHPDRPDAALLNRQYPHARHFSFTGALELNEGGWWIMASITQAEGKKSAFYELDQQGNVLRSSEYFDGNGQYMSDIAWSPAAQRLVFVGMRHGTSATDQYTHMVSIDPVTMSATQKTFDKGRYSSIIAFDDGEMLLLSNHKLELMR